MNDPPQGPGALDPRSFAHCEKLAFRRRFIDGVLAECVAVETDAA